jgi:hypothetical protein
MILLTFAEAKKIGPTLVQHALARGEITVKPPPTAEEINTMSLWKRRQHNRARMRKRRGRPLDSPFVSRDDFPPNPEGYRAFRQELARQMSAAAKARRNTNTTRLENSLQISGAA